MAAVLSILVLLTPIAVASVGVYFIVWSEFAIVATIVGVLMLLMAWALIPQMNRLDAETLGRENVPVLFGLVDDLADHMGAPRLDGIVITPQLNAFMGRFGWRRRRVMGVGMMLWQIMEPDERLSVLAHELAHEINGDPSRGILIHMAEDTLEAWIDMLAPRHRAGVLDREFGGGLAEQLLELLAWVVSLALRGLVRLHMRESQRAEYYADLLAAEAAGYEATVASERRLMLRPAIEGLVRGKIGAQAGAGRALMLQLRSHIDKLDPRALQRIEERMRAEKLSVDATHPPTIYRLRFLEHHSGLTGDFDGTGVDWVAIDAELEPYLEPTGRMLMDDPDTL